MVLSRIKSANNYSVRFRAYILALIIGAFFALLALLLFSVIVWLLQLSVELADVFTVLSFGTGCLSAGIAIGRFKKRGGLSKGFKVGLLMLLPVIPITVISGGFSAELFIGRFVIAVFCGMVGGVIGVNKKQ